MNKNSGNSKKEKIDLYTLLNVKRDADRETIKKAYKVLALKVHPDKNPDDAEAAEKFSNLHHAYNILMDDEKRQVYDQTGEIEDSVEIDLEGTYDFYKNVYPTITEKDINDFSKKYRGSELEKDDLIEFYKDFGGDMTLLLEYIPLSTNDDIDRFISIYEDFFKFKVLKKNKKFTTTKNKMNLLKEDNPEEVAKEKARFDDLCQQIMAKKSQRNNFFEGLKNKYCKGEEYDDVDEEEFKKTQQKISNRGKKK